jgi:hypothetical protein
MSVHQEITQPFMLGQYLCSLIVGARCEKKSLWIPPNSIYLVLVTLKRYQRFSFTQFADVDELV